MADYRLTDTGVIRTVDGANIPDDTTNRDWQKYLTWAGSNTVDPKDVVDLWIAGRAQRDTLLLASDYTQLADTPVSGGVQAAYVVYRQELRDLPVTFPDFNDVVWPTAP